jgi:sensor histidine kinase YesM
MKAIKRVLNTSIRYQFILVFTLSSILPIFLLGAFTYTTTLQSLKSQTLSASLLSLNKLTAQLDLVLQQVHQYLLTVSRERSILTVIEEDQNRGSLGEKSKKLIHVELDFLSTPVSVPTRVIIVLPNRSYYDNYVFFNEEKSEGVERIISEEWYLNNDRFSPFTGNLGVRKSYVTGFETEYQHYYYRNLLNPLSEHLGIALLEINTYLFDRMLASIENNSSDLILMVDEQYNLLSSSRGYANSMHLSSQTLENMVSNAGHNSLRRILGEKRFVLHANLANQPLKLIYLVGGQILMTNTTKIFLFTLILLLLLLVAELLLYSLVNSTITKPIITLSKAINTVQTGNFEVEIDISARGEIGIMAEGFNKMIVDIKEYINKIKYEEKLLKKYEFSALQAQIKPHFLSNTLHNVKLMADLAECENISKAVISLINMMQYSIGDSESTISVKKEIQYIKSYVRLTNLRFNNKFNLVNKIPEQYNNLKLLKFLLQPIVENAINHGFKDKAGIGTITMAAQGNGASVALSVTDDGAGIAKNKISEILRDDEEVEEAALSHVGIKNIDRRLKLVYGEDYGITIQSECGVGTKVSMTIPYNHQE